MSRASIRLTLVAAVLAAVATTACAPPRTRGRCSEAFDHANRLLVSGLADYVSQMRRYVTTADPSARTEEAEERARARAEAWSATHRDGAVRACHAWSEEQLICVLEAGRPADLNGCGLAPLVQSFTEEVVEDFATRPVDVRR